MENMPHRFNASAPALLGFLASGGAFITVVVTIVVSLLMIFADEDSDMHDAAAANTALREVPVGGNNGLLLTATHVLAQKEKSP